MKYDLSKLMRKAWSLYRKAMKKGTTTFSAALKSAWTWIKVQGTNAAKVQSVADALGVTEVFHSWNGWKNLNRMVCHGEECAFQVEILDPLTKRGTRTVSYFLYSQTQHEPTI